MTLLRVARTLTIVAVATIVAGCSNPEKKKIQHFEAGNALVTQQNHAEAIIEYRNAIKQDAQFGEARFKLAQSYEATKDLARAMKEYVRAADLLPNEPESQLAAARMLVLAGQFEDAKARAERVLAADPKSVQANLVLGSALVGMKDVDGAIKQVEDAVALDPLDGQSQTTLGVLQLAKGDVARAEAAFVEAVRVKPQSIEARISLASFHWIQKRTAEAEEGLKAALAIDPAGELANRALAAFAMQSGRHAEAEPYLKTLATTGDGRAKIALADFYTGMKRIDEAVFTLKPVESDATFGAQASVRLALIAYVQKRNAEAHAIVDGLITRGSETAQAQLMKGRFLIVEKKFDEAIAMLRAAVKADPKLAPAHYMLGNALLATNDLPGAADAYRATLELVPAAVPVQLQLARVSLMRGDAAGSLTAATTALEKQPENPAARIALIDALLAKRDLPRAGDEIAKLKAQYPKVAAVHVLDGKRLGLEKKLPEAARAFNQALALDATSTDAVVGLIGVDMANGDSANAIKRVEQALEKRPGDPALRLLAARAYLSGRNLPKAEETLKGLVQENPSHAVAMGMLADLYMIQGKPSQALERYEALALLDPQSFTAHTMIGMILQGQKRIPESKKRYETALEISPNAAIAANNLAWILADERQDLDRALTLANQAAALRPDDPQVADTIGWVYYQKQLPTLAVKPFERAVNKDPKNAEFQYHLGMAYAATGDTAKAKVHLQKALAISTTFNGAAEARGLLSSLGS